MNNNITNFHNQIANYLSKNYDNIIVSDLNTSDLVKNNKKLTRKVKHKTLFGLAAVKDAFNEHNHQTIPQHRDSNSGKNRCAQQ